MDTFETLLEMIVQKKCNPILIPVEIYLRHIAESIRNDEKSAFRHVGDDRVQCR